MAESAATMSLLSLSLVASEKEPLPTEMAANSNLGANGNGVGSASAQEGYTRPKTRRLSSASQTRRRVQDAREATIRNSHAQNMAGLSHATATMTLGSPPVSYRGIEMPKPAGPVLDNTQARSVGSGIGAQSLPASSPLGYHIPLRSGSGLPATATAGTTTAAPSINPANGGTVRVKNLPNGHQAYNGTVSVGALEEMPPPYATVLGSKKKGTIFRCESCSKVYRHPSCLIKHRWEHSPHWKEANRFLLSKHQQVQLLEAAAILSHITPSSTLGQGGPATSLPEDRSLWPSYLANSVPVTSEMANAAAKEEDDDGEIDVEDEGEGDMEGEGEVGSPGEGEGEGDDFEMDMEFDDSNSSTRRFRDSGFFLKGPVSSSVPAGAGSAFPRSLTHPSAAAVTTGGMNGSSGHHTRNRSRSRSISKSIHTHVIKTIRGHGRRASRTGDRDIGISLSNNPRGDVVGSLPAPADVGRITTLRPGLIGVPTGRAAASYHQPSAINDTHVFSGARSVGVGTGFGTTLAGGVGPASAVFAGSLGAHTNPSLSTGSPAPINISHTAQAHTQTHTRSHSRAPYPPDSYSSAISLPRSSVRSSSAFTEHAPELYDEPSSTGGGSGSENGKRVSPALRGGEKEGAWDGMEMEMEM